MGWALQGFSYAAIRHRAEGEENIDILKSSNTTVRVGGPQDPKYVYGFCFGVLGLSTYMVHRNKQYMV